MIYKAQPSSHYRDDGIWGEMSEQTNLEKAYTAYDALDPSELSTYLMWQATPSMWDNPPQAVTETPETDALIAESNKDGGRWQRMVEHAKTMERERNTARAQVKRIQQLVLDKRNARLS